MVNAATESVMVLRTGNSLLCPVLCGVSVWSDQWSLLFRLTPRYLENETQFPEFSTCQLQKFSDDSTSVSEAWRVEGKDTRRPNCFFCCPGASENHAGLKVQDQLAFSSPRLHGHTRTLSYKSTASANPNNCICLVLIYACIYGVFQGFLCHCCLLRFQVCLVSVKHLEKFCELSPFEGRQTAFPIVL